MRREPAGDGVRWTLYKNTNREEEGKLKKERKNQQ